MGRPLALFLVSLLLLALSGGPSPARAQDGRSFVWEQLDVAIELLPDGTFWVAESHRLRFNGTYQRAFREIPLQRVSSITEVQVGEPGQAYRAGHNQARSFAVTRDEGKVRIQWWFPPTTDATRAFELRYRVSGAIRVYPEGDQLWWIAIPGDLPAAVQSSTVSVRLPTPVGTDGLRAEGYVDGRPAPGTPSLSPTEVRFPPQSPGGREYSVRVQFPHGLVAATPPPWQAEYDRQAWYDSAVKPLLNLAFLLATLGILIVGGLLLFLRWYTAGRDPSGAPESAEVTAPPSALPPGLAGTVVDERADLQDVLATLLDLGNRGVIRITQRNDPSLYGSPVDYELELLQERPLGLHPFEKTVIGALFGGLKEVRLSKVKDRWSAKIPLFQDQLHDEATRKGLFPENPEAVRRRWRSGALAVLVLAVIGLFVAPAVVPAELAILPPLALIVMAVVALKLGPHMPRRTKAGAVEAARWRAFGRYLASSRHDPKAASPEDLTRYLPYAVALGADRSWLENFASVGRQAPRVVGANGPIIIVGPGGWGFPGPYPGGYGGPIGGDFGRGAGGPGRGAGADDNPLDSWSGGLSEGLGSASGGLADLLNAASEALSSGGGGGWSGGGGSFGGGGGSGGGSAGFD